MHILFMILIFIGVLLVVVIAHEWGHFIAARKCGMQVDEFGFGIPPRLWSWKRGNTRYSINALPIGGFVKIAGENGPEAGTEAAPLDRQFDSKPWWKKSIVLVAGVVCNIVLALILFTISYMIGMPTVTPEGTPTVVSVSAGLPADKAGIVAGDEITSATVGSRKIYNISTETLHSAIMVSTNDVTVLYTHNGEMHTATLTPLGDEGNRMIGLAVEPIALVQHSFLSAIVNAWTQTMGLIGSIVQTLGQLIVGLFDGTSSAANLVGPVGLAREVGSAATIGFAYLLAFTAAISINLAVLNILPFPALDGGRLIVVILEALFRRRFSPTVVGIIHASGFVVLLGLMAVLTVGDIRSLL